MLRNMRTVDMAAFCFGGFVGLVSAKAIVIRVLSR